MSHFTTIVFIPANTPPDQIEGKLNALLAPYDENTEVPEYDAVCWCIGKMAKEAARSQADAKYGTLDQARAEVSVRWQAAKDTLPPIPADPNDPTWSEA